MFAQSPRPRGRPNRGDTVGEHWRPVMRAEFAIDRDDELGGSHQQRDRPLGGRGGVVMQVV